MKIIILLIIISIQTLVACKLPNQKIKLLISVFRNDDSTIQYSHKIRTKLDDMNFNILSNSDGQELKIHFSNFSHNGFWNYSYIASYIITNSSDVILFNGNINMSTNNTPTDSALDKYDKIFVKKVADHINNNIKKNQCIKFQKYFDKQIALEKQQSLKNSQQLAIETDKERKRRVALAKLSQERNYKKLKKVLKIKPEYKSLLDIKTQTMLIGYYCLGDMAKALQNGMSETQMIKELEQSNFTYLPYFSQKQKDYLIEEGLSSRLIEFLELHTQEINIKKEQKRRIASLQRQREQEEKEAKEAREEEIREARRARERQEENDISAQRWRDMSNALTKTKNEMLNTIQQKANQQQYATDIYNNSISTKKRTSNYNNSYRSEQREINNNYDNKLAKIHAKKLKIAKQKKEIKHKKSGKVYKTYTDVVEDSFSSHDKKSALLNVTAGLRVKANEFCRARGWEYSDARDRKPYIISCEEVNNEVKCNARIKFGCYKYEY